MIVEMNWPSVRILGKKGLGAVVEYANAQDEPQWTSPPNTAWDYSILGSQQTVSASDLRIELVFEKIRGGHGGSNRWALNGASWTNTRPLIDGDRQALSHRHDNKSATIIRCTMHRHIF